MSLMISPQERIRRLEKRICELESRMQIITSFTACGGNASFTSVDFESDGITVLEPSWKGKTLTIWLDAVSRFIYEDLGEWQYTATGGFTILIDGFDANTNPYHVEVFVKCEL